MSNRNRIKTDTEVTGSLVFKSQSVASPEIGQLHVDSIGFFTFQDIDGPKTFNTILTGSGVFSSSNQISNLSTSSILNFDLEVSRSAQAAGFGSGAPDLTGTNIVSSSEQTGSILGLGPNDTVTFGTVQSVHGVFNGNVEINGTLTAQQVVISSSVVHITQSYNSGSTVFGDTSDDTHQFTGSVDISGSLLFDTIDGGTY